MPGAGTDKTKAWVDRPGPTVILVEPQLGDNIGAAARAMANFGLSQLRLVKPRDGWPNRRAWGDASGQPRVRLAHPRAGGAGDGLRMVQARLRRQASLRHAAKVGGRAARAAARVLRHDRA